jgi:hypothetical protein
MTEGRTLEVTAARTIEHAQGLMLSYAFLFESGLGTTCVCLSTD